MKHSIKLTDVKVNPRQRKDLGDLSGLADSIRRLGLIQPIVIAPDNTLIAGERRYRAHQQLGLESIDVIYSTELPEDVKSEIEFEENFWRKQMTWTEEALGILEIHDRKKRQGKLQGFKEDWQQIVAEMFGLSTGNIQYILVIARKLRAELSLPDEKRRYHKFTSCAEAYRLGYLADVDDEYSRINAQTKASLTPQTPKNETQIASQVAKLVANPDALAEERKRYESNPLNTQPFDEYWAERQSLAKDINNTIYLSNQFFQRDSIDFMLDPENAKRFDHIVTDPPYGIDMDNLDQENVAMNAIDRVADTHHVEDNLALLRRFYPAAFACTKDNAFVITCCDIDNWQLQKDSAIAAGFLVQRWPVIWRKINQSCMNGAAGYNTTKDFELVMICRKPGATLAQKSSTSIIDASNNEAKKLTGHPFAKPFKLTETLVNLVSIEGQTILDPFAGGGSMVLQMLKMKRKAFGVEKEPHQYNALLGNLKNHYYLPLFPNAIFK